MKTIDYYNKHAEEFTASTFEVDMESLYKPFLAELQEGAKILDVGCGSGRDTLAFKNKGYQVDAIDYSEELVKKASLLTGIPIKWQSFYEVDDYEAYDGIWACASLLHCERSRLAEVLEKNGSSTQAEWSDLYVIQIWRFRSRSRWAAIYRFR